MALKHIGIVACSAEGAALCYRTICTESPQLLGGYRHPHVSLDSHSFQDYVECLNRGDWDGVAALMLDSAQRLADAGADFLLCPDNTIHQALPRVLPDSPLPWLHIAEIVADEAASRGFRRLGILGTRWLTSGDVYPEKLETKGLAYMRPSEEERLDVNSVIMDELVYGMFKPESTKRVQTVIARMKDDGCDAVILGCTELPLILDDSNAALPTLDSTRLLARAAIRTAA